MISLLISWTKTLKWRGLNLRVNECGKDFMDYVNWDCTSMLYTQKNVLNVLTVVRKAAGLKNLKKHI